MPVWTITYLGEEKSAADWGLTAAPRIRTRDRSPTSVSFRLAGAAPEGSIPFPFKAPVTIRQNRTFAGTWSGTGFIFIGWQTTQHGQVDGRHQGIVLEFQDVLWLLQNTTFQQIWKANASDGMGGITTVDQPVSRCVLFMDITSYIATPWSIKSVQWQLNEIITYAAGCKYDGTNYIPIAAGTIDYSGWYINYYHCRAISCWDALLKCLEPVPDAKVWVDNSSGSPMLNIRTRANIAAMSAPTGTAAGPITLPYKGTDAAGRKHLSSELTPRYDLIPPQVVIQYQTANTIDGKSAPGYANDVYPGGSDGKAAFAMVVPIDLSGFSASTMTGQLDCETLACVGGTQASKRAWWASKRGGEHAKLADFRTRFQDTTGAAVTIGDATVTDDSGATISLATYPRRLVKGSHHAWMNNGGTAINCIRAHIRVKVQCAEYDVAGSTPAETDTNGNVIRKSTSHELHCHVTLTNSPNGLTTYNGVTFDTVAEVAATNLAQNIYTARQALDYDGTHEIVDAGILGTRIPLQQIIGHWNVLNLSGGASAWATANMTIAGTEIDLLTNHQRIDIGPSKHLSPQDWSEMLQFFRSRRVYIVAGTRATGYGNSGVNVDMARNTPDANTVAGLTVDAQQTLIGPDSVDATRSIVINQDSATGQVKVVQQNTASNTVYTTGLITPQYSGAGAPAAGTLAASAYYRVRDRYLDTAAKATYDCTTAGSNSTSVWVKVGGGGGGFSMYDNTSAYFVGAFIVVPSVVTVGGIVLVPGTYGCLVDVPANGTGNQIPQFPLPGSGTLYWYPIAFGPVAVNACVSGVNKTIYLNSSAMF